MSPDFTVTDEQENATLHGVIERVLLTGISEIDDDHLRFADLTAELMQAIKAGDSARVEAAARALEPHGSCHFAMEEALLIKRGYDSYDKATFDAHVAEHARIHQEIIAILAKPALTTVDALAVQTMLAEHLLQWDVKYMSFLGSRGAGALF